jgi:hypothetical protein
MSLNTADPGKGVRMEKTVTKGWMEKQNFHARNKFVKQSDSNPKIK